MYIIAIIGDTFRIIPIVNLLSDGVTGFALYVAGEHTGISLYSDDQITATLVAYVAGAIPVFPVWTTRVYFAKRDAKRRELEEESMG
jgi:hypothetical protein